MQKMRVKDIHPQLQKTFKKAPKVPVHIPGVLPLVNLLTPFVTIFPNGKLDPSVSISNIDLGTAAVRVYIPDCQPKGAALIWIHGGGLVLGSPNFNDSECVNFALELGIPVFSCKYRLAPKHRFPAAHDDCYSVWAWLQEHASEYGVDPKRVVIGGQSAGGNLAAGVTHRLKDEAGVQPAGQLLFCPMLDDRTATRTELNKVKHLMWNNQNNHFGWRSYLGQAPGSEGVSDYAAPARREDLNGLPPTWVGVGDIDLFYEEDRDYARRLKEVAVDCQMEVVPKAPHAFESLAPEANISKALWQSSFRFMRRVCALD